MTPKLDFVCEMGKEKIVMNVDHTFYHPKTVWLFSSWADWGLAFLLNLSSAVWNLCLSLMLDQDILSPYLYFKPKYPSQDDILFIKFSTWGF